MRIYGVYASGNVFNGFMLKTTICCSETKCDWFNLILSHYKESDGLKELNGLNWQILKRCWFLPNWAQFMNGREDEAKANYSWFFKHIVFKYFRFGLNLIMFCLVFSFLVVAFVYEKWNRFKMFMPRKILMSDSWFSFTFYCFHTSSLAAFKNRLKAIKLEIDIISHK